MPQFNGEWIDREDLEIRVVEGWKRVMEKINGTADELERLIDASVELRKAIDRVGNEFDALGPLLDALGEDDEEEPSE